MSMCACVCVWHFYYFPMIISGNVKKYPVICTLHRFTCVYVYVFINTFAYIFIPEIGRERRGRLG